MKFVWFIVAIVGLCICVAMAQSKLDSQRSISLRSGSQEVVVPAGRLWKVEGLTPYESERGIGTADLYIDGQMFVGPDRDLNVSGKFDILINKTQKFPLWILAGSKVRVGDSRQQLVITEFRDK
jgi:hypothetical protein